MRSKLLILCLLTGLLSCREKTNREVQTVQVRKGTFIEELTEQGSIRAVKSVGISAPATSYRYGSLKISRIVEDGKLVQKGDTLVIFDPSEFQKAAVNAQQQLDIARAEYDKLKATQESEIQDLESDLEIAELSQEISRINFEQSEYESEVTRKEIRLKLETANIALERAREQIANRKKIHSQELLQKKLTINQNTVILEDAQKSIKSLFLVSPGSGIAIVRENWMSGQKLKVGDSPGGGSIIELPEMAEMMAELKINEVDISKITPGLKVEIRVDAFSDSTFTGEITKVANLAQNKDWESRIKVFPVEVSINGMHANLLPGLTVSCRIRIREIPDVVYVPVGAVFKEQGIEFVYVRSGSGFKRREVKVGPSNTDFAVIEEGLTDKEEVALTDPFLNREEKGANGQTKIASLQ